MAVSRLAVRRLALVTRPQALAAGMSPGQIKRRVSSGLWVRVNRGVYRLGGAPPSREQDWLAACLAAGRGAVVSHRGAAVLWGLRGVAWRAPEITCRAMRSRS